MVQVYLVDAFVDRGLGGNPAGVVLDAGCFTAEQQQAIATRVGLSETAFVSDSETAGFRIDFFTPTARVGDCGHATVAAFSLLKEKGLLTGTVSSKELVNGQVREIQFEDGMVFMEQAAPQYRELSDSDLEALRRSLGLPADRDWMPARPMVVNTGENFLLLPLSNAEEVARLQPDMDAVTALSKKHQLIGYYVFSTETSSADRHAGARMFAPLYGIPEESATGMGAGPCACFMADVMGYGLDTLFIEQGRFMEPPSPSFLRADFQWSGEKVSGLRVGGYGKVREMLDVTL